MANKQQKYDPNLFDTLVWSLAAKGYTNQEICEAINISDRTFLRWRDKYPSFNERFVEGRTLATAKVEEALFKRATGFFVTEEETVIRFDNDGNRMPVNVKSKKKHYAPDPSSMIFWLKNRDSANWKDKVEVEEKGGDGLAESLLTQVRMMNIEALEAKEREEKAEREAKNKEANQCK